MNSKRVRSGLRRCRIVEILEDGVVGPAEILDPV